jgi:hypothetical protein
MPRVEASQGGGNGGTEVPKPPGHRTRSRAEKCDTGAGADVGQTSRTLTDLT